MLEAMSCGCPVVASSAASLPEVVGDAGVTVDPNDIDGLADAVQDLTSQKDLLQEIIERGLERASRFSWEMSARSIASTYATVLGAAAWSPTSGSYRTS